MFARYNQKAQKIEPMFAHHAFYPKNMPAENNVWGTLYGRGSFSKSFRKMLRAKEFCKQPYEIATSGRKTQKIYICNDTIQGELANTFEDLTQSKGNALLKCQSSDHLSFLPAESIDAVITDPPYYDNVMYSELSDFYYIWLRIGLRDKYAWFEPEYSPKNEEVVVNKTIKKDEKFFIESLAKILKECYRVLKNNGLLTFTFHHRKEAAWEAILKSTFDAGFYIVNIYPVHNEMHTSFHILNKKAIKYDTIIVCKKILSGVKEEHIEWDNLLSQISSYAVSIINDYLSQRLHLGKEDILVILRGKCLQLYSKHYPNIFKNGKNLGISEALKDVTALIEHTLSKADINEHQDKSEPKQALQTQLY